MGGPRLQDRGPDGHAHLGLGRVTGRIWTDARRHGMPVGHPAVVKISLTIPAHTLACRAEPPSGTAARVHLVLALQGSRAGALLSETDLAPRRGRRQRPPDIPDPAVGRCSQRPGSTRTASPAAAPQGNSPPWDLAGMAACADRHRARVSGGRAFPGPTGPGRVSRRRGAGRGRPSRYSPSSNGRRSPGRSLAARRRDGHLWDRPALQEGPGPEGGPRRRLTLAPT